MLSTDWAGSLVAINEALADVPDAATTSIALGTVLFFTLT